MTDVVDRIRHTARGSAVAAYYWPRRGPAPPGYVEGMAVTFGRVHCKLKAGDRAVAAIGPSLP